jgi:hypothetical protein
VLRRHLEMAKRDLTSRVYTDNEGNDYSMKMDAGVATEVGADLSLKVGGSDYDGTPPLPPMPTNLIPRHVIVSNAGDKRRVICLETSAQLFTGVETTITLQQLGSAALVYTRVRANHEKWKRRGDPTD